MAERDRKDDPITNQKRVMDATIAKSEAEEQVSPTIVFRRIETASPAHVSI